MSRFFLNVKVTFTLKTCTKSSFKSVSSRGFSSRPIDKLHVHVLYVHDPRKPTNQAVRWMAAESDVQLVFAELG